MAKIELKEREHFEAAFRRFRKEVENSGIINELRLREQYEKPSEIKQRKKAAAVKRWRKTLAEQTLPPKQF